MEDGIKVSEENGMVIAAQPQVRPAHINLLVPIAGALVIFTGIFLGARYYLNQSAKKLDQRSNESNQVTFNTNQATKSGKATSGVDSQKIEDITQTAQYFDGFLTTVSANIVITGNVVSIEKSIMIDDVNYDYVINLQNPALKTVRAKFDSRAVAASKVILTDEDGSREIGFDDIQSLDKVVISEGIDLTNSLINTYLLEIRR